jgi:outer membrane scaffolding protein for murein synthesis (MipA/OmpV family)
VKKSASPRLLRTEYPLCARALSLRLSLSMMLLSMLLSMPMRLRMVLRRGGFLLLGFTATLPAFAQPSCVDDCVEIGAWRVNVGMGLGMRSNPLNGGDDIPLVVLPEVSYYGERFFLKNLEMGFTLFENERHQFNALVTPGYDQMYFNRWDPFNFTDAGGFTAGSGPAAPLAASSYQVEISGPRSPADTGSSSAGPNIGANGIYVASARAVVINDQPIALINGTQYLFGAEGNSIAVQIADDRVSIMGVVHGDRIELAGVDVKNAEDLDSRGNAELEFAGPDGGADSLWIDPVEGGRYRVTANATAQASAAQKISADQVAHRKMAGLAGFEYSYIFSYASLHVQALSDFTSVHGGHEVRAAVIFPWQIGEQKWAVTFGGNYKSRHILDYYYGVNIRDTDITSLHFSPTSAGIEAMARLDWQLPLSDNWSLRAMLQYSELPDNIAGSPLISERGVGSAFFGGIYHF